MSTMPADMTTNEMSPIFTNIRLDATTLISSTLTSTHSISLLQK